MLARIFGSWKTTLLGLGGAVGIVWSAFGCSVSLTDTKVWVPAFVLGLMGLLFKEKGA